MSAETFHQGAETGEGEDHPGKKLKLSMFKLET
jgi:hypothetical protein